MTENAVQFLPFHAINEFMRGDFRLSIIRRTLADLKSLPESKQEILNRLIKRTVKVPGFRNSDKAPAAVKVIPTAKAFETNPDLVAAVLAAWTDLHTELGERVFQILERRGWYFFPPEMKAPADLPSLKTEKDWGILPLEADRTRLPGFLIYWPENQDFEAIYENFIETYPEADNSIDEVSLMTVWLTNRLPYHVLSEEPESGLTNQEPDQTE